MILLRDPDSRGSAIPEGVVYFELQVGYGSRGGWCEFTNRGEVIARVRDRLEGFRVAMKFVRRQAVNGPVIVTFHGVNPEELRERLAEAKARWPYPEWWLNVEWRIAEPNV